MMRYTISGIILIIAVSALSLYSEIYVNGLNISKEIDLRFVELVFKKDGSNSINNIHVNSGKDINSLKETGVLTKRNGNLIVFKDLNDLMNYIRGQGWTALKSFISCTSGKSFYHFFFRK